MLFYCLFSKEKLVFLFVLAFLSIVTVRSAVAQTSETPTPSPTKTPSQAETDLDEEIRIAEKEAKLAKAKKEKTDTLPTPTSTPLNGSVTGAKDLKMEANIQTYKAIRQITDRIACDIRQNVSDANVFIIYKQDVYLAWRNYKSMDKALKDQLNDMKVEYDIWLLDNVTAKNNFLKNYGLSGDGSGDGAAISALTSTALLGAGTAARSLVDLLSVFRTDVDFTYLTVNVNENALKSMIADSLRRTSYTKQCQKGDINKSTFIYDPDTFYPLTTQNSTNRNPSILGYVSELSKRKRAAEVEIAIYDIFAADITKFNKDIETAGNSLAGLDDKMSSKNEAERNLTLEIAKTKNVDEKIALTENRSKVQQEIASLTTKKENIERNLTKTKQALSELEKKMDLKYRLKISRLRQLNSEFSQFFTAVNTRDANSQVSPLMLYTKIESLDAILENDDSKAYWVEAHTVEAGGANRVQKNLIRYFYKPDISFSGGAIVEYSVSSREGILVLSNSDRAYEKYKKASKILD